MKEYLTARQAAENYGLQVKRNELACCPFHNDKHPSMKIDRNYHCFACGVGGDEIYYACGADGSTGGCDRKAEIGATTFVGAENEWNKRTGRGIG